MTTYQSAADYQTTLREIHCKPCKMMNEQTCLFCQVTTDIHNAHAKEITRKMNAR
jgi:hypothetical protein